MTGQGHNRNQNQGHGPDSPARKVRRRLVALRFMQGRDRMRQALVPVLQASVAAAVSYAFAVHVLGHDQPFFAPIAAWVCLGFTSQRELRRVAELGVGVALGVGFGDLLAHGIGSGAWQIGFTLFAAALLARFLDRGQMLTMQAGVQAIVIIGLPQMSAVPIGRWTDALAGAVTAFLIATLTPGDPRRHARGLGAEATTALAEMLRLLARGLRTGNTDDLDDALARGRATQNLLERWEDSAIAGFQNTRLDAAARKYRSDFLLLEQQAMYIDRAVRSVRVIARRAGAVVHEDHDWTPLAEVVGETAQAAQALAGAIGSGGDLAPIRVALRTAAGLADPADKGIDDWQVQGQIVLMRAPIFDLLRAAGMNKQDANEALPKL